MWENYFGRWGNHFGWWDNHFGIWENHFGRAGGKIIFAGGEIILTGGEIILTGDPARAKGQCPLFYRFFSGELPLVSLSIQLFAISNVLSHLRSFVGLFMDELHSCTSSENVG